MIADLLQETDLLASLRVSLKSIRDIERAVGRLSQASGNARDLVALKTSLQQLPTLKAELQNLVERINFGTGREVSPPHRRDPTNSTDSPESRPDPSLAAHLQDEIHEMPKLAEKLTRAVVDGPPLALKEGGIFRDGYDLALDSLRQASHDGKNWISQLQEREIAATGIKSLKVRYNSVFGYFIEITKSNLASVPEHYTRKQTTSAASDL
jgi:DNA mismatch repair protein MutS